MKLNDFKKRFDKYLLSFIENKINNLPPHKNKEIAGILKHLYEISSEGKRIRPYLAYLAFISCGGKDKKEALRFFVFLEIFHLFCLVHDDVMDKADTRHGLETINSRYKDSQAILIGDLLLSWSFDNLLANQSFPDRNIEEVRKIFFEMIDEVCLGQMLDVNIGTKKIATDEEIKREMFLKTATYSFINPLRIGIALAGKRNNDFVKLGKYLGNAFQIQDDLLDVKYDISQTKKSSFNDVYQNQHTLLSNFIFKNGTKEQKALLRKLFGKKLNDNDKKILKTIFQESGAIDFGEKEVIKNLNLVKEIIAKIKIENKYKDVFLSLVENLINRSS